MIDFFVRLQSKGASLAGQSFAGKNSLRPEPGPLFGGKLIELTCAGMCAPVCLYRFIKIFIDYTRARFSLVVFVQMPRGAVVLLLLLS